LRWAEWAAERGGATGAQWLSREVIEGYRGAVEERARRIREA
jgi:hypothetical protein